MHIIDDGLFKQLKKDYKNHKENKHYQSQLQSGFDYMEAMIKFFGVLSISVVRDIDAQMYKEIFSRNFKLSPSLGDFKSLTTDSFPQVPKRKKQKALDLKARLENKNEIYDFLANIFNEKIELKLTDVQKILEGHDGVREIISTIELLNTYAVTFRNKLKGHGASFRDEDSVQRDLILENLDKVLEHLEYNYNSIVQDAEVVFTPNANNAITLKYRDTACEILPIISYIECDKFSCSEQHKTKLFFYNDGQESKSHYIDYSYNHFHQVTQVNEIHKDLKALQEEVLHATSDTTRRSFLLANFVGREEELRSTKEHIQNAIKEQKSSFISIIGKPGIGKSAFLTQLQQRLEEDLLIQDEINSYTFYVQKDKMGGVTEEEKELWNKISAYFDQHGVSINRAEGEVFALRTSLEKLFRDYEESKHTKPLLLIIDGLDEFANATDMIKNIPLTFSSKIHIIYSSRNDKNIPETISSSLSENTSLKIFKKEQVLSHGYSLELGKLLSAEVEELLSCVLPKDISRESEDYKEIVEAIAKQSDSLPLYIYFITQELKEKNIKEDENITDVIKKWATNLPSQIERFYLDRFEKTDSLSRSILYMLLFSHTTVSKKDFYKVLRDVLPQEFITTEGRRVDEVTFTQEYFNDIEVFLSVDSENRYGFYHLSVKEQLLEYLQTVLQQAAKFGQETLKELMFECVVEHYSDAIREILYIEKGSDIYKLLEGLTEHVDIEITPRYYKDNYFHLLNTFIWTNIHISQISYEDMENKKYESILERQEITQKSKKEIESFYKLFDEKEDKYLFEIRYAYELAFIAKDYSQVLVYKDMYENYVQAMFLEIALNINKPEYVQKFIDHESEWISGIDKNMQDIFISIISNQTKVDESFYRVYLFLTADQKLHVLHLLAFDKSMNMIEEIIDSHPVDKRLCLRMVERIKRTQYLEIALLQTLSLKEMYVHEVCSTLYKYKHKIKDLKNIYKLIKLLPSKSYQKDVLEFVLNHKQNITSLKYSSNIIDEEKLLKKASEIVEKEDSKWGSSLGLIKLINQSPAIQISLKIVEKIALDSLKFNALYMLASRTMSKNDLYDILMRANAISNNKLKSDILAPLALETKDMKRSLEIISQIPCSTTQNDLLKVLVPKLKTKKHLKQAIKIIKKMPNDDDKIESLPHIIVKIKDEKLLKKVKKIVDRIESQELKSQALFSKEIVDKEVKAQSTVAKILETPFYNKTPLPQLLEKLKREYDKKVLNETIGIILRQNYTFEEIDSILDYHYMCYGLDARMELEKMNFNLSRFQLLEMINNDIYKIENVFLTKFFNKNIAFLDTLEFIAYLSPKSILKFFGIKK